jgi:hypothetical protein
MQKIHTIQMHRDDTSAAHAQTNNAVETMCRSLDTREVFATPSRVYTSVTSEASPLHIHEHASER